MFRKVVNISSIAGTGGNAGQANYSAGKAGIIGLTKALSKEYAPHQILVNSVCIGLVRAGQHERRAAREGVDVETIYDNLGKNIPIGRVGRADEAANVIAFLVSEAASFVTGSSINIDGGASAVF